jgi:very-short-patch-repair endonuclease
MRTDVDLAVARLASTQHGVFSYGQVLQSAGCLGLAVGAAQAFVRRRFGAARWERVAPGVYRLPGYPDSWEQQLTVAVLDAGEDAVVSHRAAALLWGLDGVRGRPVEATVPRGRRRFRNAIVHETRPFAANEVDVRRGIPVTSVAMTLVQLGAVVPDVIVEQAYESARRAGLVEEADVLKLLECRRAGVKVMTRVLARRSPSAVPTDSTLETRFAQLVRRARVPVPVRQYEGTGYRIDFAWPTQRVAVELDGLAFHDGRDAQRRDRERQNRVVLDGWRVLRFTWHDVTRRSARVVAAIERALTEDMRH